MPLKKRTGTCSRRDLLQAGPLTVTAGLFGPAAASAASLPKRGDGPEVYTRLGVRPFINCTSTYTINGGSALLPEVVEAIRQASHYHVNIDELMAAVGERIAAVGRTSRDGQFGSGGRGHLRHGGVSGGRRSGDNAAIAGHYRAAERSDRAEVVAERLRPRGAQLRRQDGRGGDTGGRAPRPEFPGLHGDGAGEHSGCRKPVLAGGVRAGPAFAGSAAADRWRRRAAAAAESVPGRRRRPGRLQLRQDFARPPDRGNSSGTAGAGPRRVCLQFTAYHVRTCHQGKQGRDRRRAGGG